jgi:hypothetical protein
MHNLTAEEIIEAIDEAHKQEEFQYRSYSGRGMFGKQCLGITFSNVAEALAFGAWLGQTFSNPYGRSEETTASALLLKTRQDSMGRGIVIYWPELEYSGPSAESEDEDEDE